MNTQVNFSNMQKCSILRLQFSDAD